jgi:hypothetical protein
MRVQSRHRVAVTGAAAITAVAVFVAVLVMAGAAQAALIKMSPTKLTRTAQRVVVADVWSVEAQHVKPRSGAGWGTIVTVVRLRVDDALKGAAPRWMTLRIPGGSADGRSRVVEDAPGFYPGERCLLFLDAHGVVGWRQGVVPVVDGRVEAWNMSLPAAGRKITGVMAGKAVRFSAAPRTELRPSIAITEQIPAGAAATFPAPTPAPRLAGARGATQTTLISDTFEGTMGAWTLLGTPAWGQTTYRANGGTKSAYCAQSAVAAPGPYPLSFSNWMIAGPFDLSDATAASLTFTTWLALGAGDTLCYGFSTNGSNFSLAGWTAVSTGGWLPVTQDLGNFFTTSYLGQPAVWIACYFASDAATTAEGAYVDNVVLTKTVAGVADPAITSITPGSASAGTGTNVTIAGTNFGASQGTGSVTFYYNGTDRITSPVVSWSDTQIVCTVPTGTVKGYPASAASGPVIVTNNAGGVSLGYGFTVTFSYGGVKWASPAVTYTINANCVDSTGETAAIDAAWPTWNPPALWTLSRAGTNATTALPIASNSSHDIFWSQTSLGSGVLAVNQYWYAGSTIIDSDIAFNDADFTWGDGTAAGTYDIQTVATHELGHTINLRDLYGPGDSGDIMYGYSGSGPGGVKHALSADDSAGVVWVYGARPAMSGAMRVNSNAAWSTSTTVTLNSAIANATQMRFSNDNAAWSDWEAYAAARPGWALAAGEGAKTIYGQYKDAGGNAYSSSDAIGLDLTAPSTTNNTDGLPHQAFGLVLTVTDATSGVALTQYRIDGGGWTTGTTVTLRLAIRHKRPGLSRATHTAEYRSTDNAGNLESIKSCSVTLGG